MTTSKQYDYLNRLTAIASQANGAGVVPISFNYSYNLANQRTKDTLADGSHWVYGYDSLGQVTNGVKYFSDNTLVPGQQFNYTFDTIGNRKQTRAGGDQNGANQRLANNMVNSLNQITNRYYPGTNDVVGVALATNTATVNGQTAWRKGEYFWSPVSTNNTSSAEWEQVTVASGGSTSTGGLFVPATPETFTYDLDGNLLTDGRWKYTWDAENRLVAMTNNTGVGPLYGLAYVYDAKGRRIQKSVTTNGTSFTTLNFMYDGWNPIAILNSSSAILETFTWGSDLSGSQQGAGGVGGLLTVSYRGTATTNCFVAYDGNGNVAGLINAAGGALVANYEYGPFGEVIRQTGPMAKVNPFRFSTKYQDDESDLLYYGYRYYKASTGTWISKDPLDDISFLASYSREKVNDLVAHFAQEVSDEGPSASMLRSDILLRKLMQRIMEGKRPYQMLVDRSKIFANEENSYGFGQNSPVDRIDNLGLTSLLYFQGCLNKVINPTTEKRCACLCVTDAGGTDQDCYKTCVKCDSLNNPRKICVCYMQARQAMNGGSGATADPTDFQIKEACKKCPDIDIPLPKPKPKPPEIP